MAAEAPLPESILVVEDEDVLRRNLLRYLRSRGHRVEGATNGREALDRLREEDFSVVLTDLRMAQMSGTELLGRIVDEFPETMALVMTAYASLETALEALHMGAQDYILKPFVLEDVSRRIDNLLARRDLELRVGRLRREVQKQYDTSRIIGRSAAMARVKALVGKAGPSGATVLIVGETGTGKELLARAIHEASPVAERDFVAVNLAAVPTDLVDATLFGHERGAFTGATGRREGVLRAAKGGTVFLDEVGELPMPVQAKLLRVLENREVMPLGMDRPVPVDFRLIAATNRSSQEMAGEGAFRKDLYFRLNVFGIEVPPLRARREDIAELANHFLARHVRATGKRVVGIHNEAMRRMLAYDWPGNVRELSNVVERAVLLTEGEWVTVGDLPGELRESVPEPMSLKAALERFKAAHIHRVLAETGGDKDAAARRLEIHLATLYRHLEASGEP
jgi:DNA-binding NtrC family response regulator